MLRSCPRQHGEAAATICEGAGEFCKINLGDFIHRQRDDPGREPLAKAGQRIDQGLAMFGIMHKKNGILAAGFMIAFS